jgi:2-dehydrotetronate isomerase
MPHFAANLSMLYNEHPFLDRFKAAAADGFTAVEFLFPYEFEPAILAKCLSDNGLQQVLFNAPPGNWAAGERGMGCVPGREADFKASITTALHYADALQCPRLHVMAGLTPANLPHALCQNTLLSNLKWAAQQASKHGVMIQLEPLNTRDNPGYFLTTQAQAHELVALVDEPNVQVQMDLYHCQIMEGDLSKLLKRYLPTGKVGHLQIAGVPERHEPDVGEINYPYLFDLIDSLGWQGYVGCEYRPRRGLVANATRDGLGWLKR